MNKFINKINFATVVLMICFVIFDASVSFSYKLFPTMDNDIEDSIITIEKPDDFMTMFINKDGTEIIRTYGKYNSLNKLFDLKTKQLSYIIEEKINYTNNVYHHGNHRYADVDTSLYSLDGNFLNNIIKENTLAKFNYIGILDSFVLYSESYSNIDTEEDIFTIHGYNIKDGQKLNLFNKKSDINSREDYAAPSDLLYHYNNGILYFVLLYNHDLHILKINNNASVEKYTYSNNSEDYEDRLTLPINENNFNDYLNIVLSDLFINNNFENYNYADYLDKIENLKHSIFLYETEKRNKLYKNTIKYEIDKTYNISDDMFEITKFNNKLYSYRIENKNSNLEKLSDYRFTIFDGEGNEIEKNISICEPNTIVELYVDWASGDAPVFKERYNCDKIPEKWIIDETVKNILSTNVYYKKNKNNKYDMYSVDGKLIVNDIDDYIINTTYFYNQDNRYTLKINNEWTVLDENFNVIANKINPYYNETSIIRLKDKNILKLEKDLSFDLYDKDGLMFKNIKYCRVEKGKYLNITTAFNYGLIDIDGNWAYKYNAFDSIDDAFDFNYY